MSEAQPVYRAILRYADNEHAVDGPGDGFGYYAGTLWPDLKFTSQLEAEAAATLCNTAYAEGYKQAQRDIRKALGIP